MLRSCFAVTMMVLLAGCGGGGDAKPLPKTEPVTGTVTLDDQPLEGALVMFIPSGTTKGIECSGQTDASGVYTPKQTRGAEGVPAGTYKVVISRFLSGGKPVTPGSAAEGGAGGVLTESLPPKYSNPGISQLTATVPEGGETIDFQLTTK